MSCSKDVLQINKKLEKFISSEMQDHSAPMELLNMLKKMPITLEVLEKTHVGMTVNNLRKSCKDDDVMNLSKSLIKSWKKLLPSDSNSSNNSKGSHVDSPINDENSAKETEQESKASGSKKNKGRPVSPETSAAENHSVRNKCRAMLIQALMSGSLPEGIDADTVESIGGELEECIAGDCYDLGMKYKNRIRSRYSNLKDTKNPTLRIKVLLKEISAEKFAVMSPEEMASDDLNAMREKLDKESTKDAQMAVSGGTITDLLKCGKCKGRSCTYNQMQTRSADEPMTTFCFCNDCGNRWKFC